MSTVNKPKLSNKSSLLLHNDENETLFSCLGNGCVTLATGVVQLYLSDSTDGHRWNKRCCGVATFVRDNGKRSYYIRVYDLKNRSMLWEQELYNQFRYKSPRDYFHTFECESHQAALNFASEDEANLFKGAVEQKLRERSQRKMAKKNRSIQQKPSPTPSNAPSMTSLSGPPSNQPPKMTSSIDTKVNNTGTLGKNKKKDKKKAKLTKDDISTPTNFKHISHVGWDPNKGFDMNNLEPEMQNLFQSVGINPSDEVDEATVEFIYDFVEKHGGIDAVKKEIAQRPAPPPPPTSAPRGGPPPPPPMKSPSSGGAPPPPPQRTPVQHGAPPPPPTRVTGGRPAPPGKYSARPPAAAPPPPPPVSAPAARPPPPPAAGVPPPPPPPAVGAAPPAPPPPPPGGMNIAPSGGNNDARANLMDDIRAGKKLTTPTLDNSSTESSGDSHDQLLKQIQSGSKLKPVEQVQQRNPSINEQDGLVGALARALANRQKAVRGSDDEDSDDDDESDEIDDDEWDDN